MNGQIILLSGLPASGKTKYCKKFTSRGFKRLSRDDEGGKLSNLIRSLSNLYLEKNLNKFILDGTYSTTNSRKAVIQWAHEYNFSIEGRRISTGVGDALFNASKRMIKIYGKLLTSEEIRKSKNPNMFPSSVIHKYNKSFQDFSIKEGFSNFKRIRFKRKRDLSLYRNKALILDYDGTLRVTKSGKSYPIDPDDILILPKRKDLLKKYQQYGYYLLGVSNQSGIESGKLTLDQAINCFEKTYC